jgi:hypothetical protein
MVMEQDYVSEPWPLTGLLFIPPMIHEYGELRRNYTDRKQQKNSRENPVAEPHFPSQIPHVETQARTLVSAVRSQHLTAQATAR